MNGSRRGRRGGALRALPGVAMLAALAGLALLWSWTGKREESPGAGESELTEAPGEGGGDEPSEVRAVAGIVGFRSRSILLFEALPSAPHSLEAVYSFPDRGFWRFRPIGGRGAQRLLVYRYGAKVYHVLADSDSSVLLKGEDLQAAILQMELRLAAMMWPDGRDWHVGSDPDRIVLDGIGALETSGADPSGRSPTGFRSYLPDGRPFESLTAVFWVEHAGRRWPGGWTLSTPEGVVWRETIESVVPGGLYADRYFLPHDSNPDLQTEAEPLVGAVQAIVLPPKIARRFPLPVGSGWLEALVQAGALVDHWRTVIPESPGLDAAVEIELSLRGQPVALRLRLLSSAGPVPEGWELIAETAGSSMLVRDPRTIQEGMLKSLREHSPHVSGTPYLRIDPSAPSSQWAQLVLPLADPK